jgi:3-hydroxyisobutyrate dehydrogenase-like beta-hydroxyacid dehydrogenase
MLSVGVIGVGVIGKPIAERLLDAGFRVLVYDVRSEPVQALQRRGVHACASSAEVAEATEIIISLVMDTPQTDDVVSGPRGIVHTIKPGTLFATGSTLGPAPVIRIAETLAAKGCDTLDMPITGGYLAASVGKLALMVGGTRETLDRAAPVLQAFSHVITHAGAIGAGQAAKVAHQLIMGVNIIGLLEGLSLGVAGGVQPDVLKKIVKDGIANSTVLEMWEDLGPRWKGMLAPTAPDTPLPNLRKDLHTALQLARELNVNLYLGTQASLVADAGAATGHDNPAL